MSDVRIELLKAVKTTVNAASFSPNTDRIEDAKRQVAKLMSYVESLEAPKPKSRRKTRGKSGKATPSTKVADRQERQFHGKADTPVTPRHTKRTASVEEARKSAQEVSDKSGATARAERKKDLMAEAVTKELGKEMQVTHLNDEANTRIYTFGSHEERVASLEASIEQLTNTLAVMMTSNVTPAANEVCFSDLPFDPTSTL
jgi:hypothetical protein